MYKKVKSSLPSHFTFFLIIFFIVQLLLGIAFVSIYIKDSFFNFQEKHLINEISSRKHSLDTYLQDRVSTLDTYAQLPQIIFATRGPYNIQPRFKKFLEKLDILNEKVSLSIQNIDGIKVYSTAPQGFPLPSKSDFEKLVNKTNKNIVSAIEISDFETKAPFWRISVPIFLYGNSSGVLTAYIPINIKRFTESDHIGKHTVFIESNSKILSQLGDAGEPSISKRVESNFKGIFLSQRLSLIESNKKINHFIVILVVGLTIIGLILFIFLNYIGKKFLIVPHENLQATSDALEIEVQKRTKQLNEEVRERVEAEQEAKESEKLIKALLEGVGAAFFIIDPKSGKIVNANNVVEQVFGVNKKDIINKNCNEILEINDTKTGKLCPDINYEPYSEATAKHADGTIFPIARYIVQIQIKDRKHLGIIILNITERKNLERRLSIAQKLESVGALASGMAHEINTPIQYTAESIRFLNEAFNDMTEILNLNDKLENQCKINESCPTILSEINKVKENIDYDFLKAEIPEACLRAEDGTKRVATIVKAMREFSHPGDGDKSLVDINKALRNTIAVTKGEWKYSSVIVEDFGEIPVVRCLPGDINQVFLNMMVNAAHAIADKVKDTEKKGKITLKTFRQGDKVVIQIADSGKGIPASIRDKIFNPFFTTKEVGKGTGQGLAIVHDIIVKRHNGSIDVKSKENIGSIFTITLPIN